MKRDDIYYHARCLRNVDIYDVSDIQIRTVNEEERWFTGMEFKGRGDNKVFGQTRLFWFSDIGVTVFKDYVDALSVVKEAKKGRVELNETYFEEY